MRGILLAVFVFVLLFPLAFAQDKVFGISQKVCEDGSGLWVQPSYDLENPFCQCGPNSGGAPRMEWNGSQCMPATIESLCQRTQGVYRTNECICPKGTWIDNYGCENVQHEEKKSSNKTLILIAFFALAIMMFWFLRRKKLSFMIILILGLAHSSYADLNETQITNSCDDPFELVNIKKGNIAEINAYFSLGLSDEEITTKENQYWEYLQKNSIDAVCDMRVFIESINQEISLGLAEDQITQIMQLLTRHQDHGDHIIAQESINSLASIPASLLRPFGYRDDAPYLVGDVLMVGIFVDDPDDAWTVAHRNDALTRFTDLTNYINSNKPSHVDLSFGWTYETSFPEVTTDPNECTLDNYDCICRSWMHEAINELGYSDQNQDGSPVDEYLDNKISQFNKDHAFILFVLHSGGSIFGNQYERSYACSRNSYPTSAIYAYEWPGCIFGFCNDEEFTLYAHEALHLFGAVDEYYQSSDNTGCQQNACSTAYNWGYENDNCENCNPLSLPSIMKDHRASTFMNLATKGMIGWGDSDSDDIPDPLDNCQHNYNPNQENFDGDSLGDACDPNDDNDFTPDSTDACPKQYGTYCNGCPAPSCSGECERIVCPSFSQPYCDQKPTGTICGNAPLDCDTQDTTCRNYHDKWRTCSSSGICTGSCNVYTNQEVGVVCGQSTPIHSCSTNNTEVLIRENKRLCDGTGFCKTFIGLNTEAESCLDHEYCFSDGQGTTAENVYCKSNCMVPSDAMTIAASAVLCPGEYHLPTGIAVGADNITIKCNSTSLIGTGSNYGISNFGYDDVTIVGCTVEDYLIGTIGSISKRMHILNNTFQMNSIGVVLQSNSDEGTIQGNTIHYGNDGIDLIGTASTTITENKIHNLNHEGVSVSFSNHTNITKNSFSSNDYGVRIAHYDNNYLSKNTFNKSRNSSIKLGFLSKNNIIYDNVLEDAGIEYQTSNIFCEMGIGNTYQEAEGPSCDIDSDGFYDYQDCNDADAEIHPDAPEICDGIDNNCNGLVDEGLDEIESCGVGVCSGGERTRTCVDGSYTDWSACSTDHFQTTEVCDGLDNDCDGLLDDAEGLTQECGTTNIGLCSYGIESCSEDGIWEGCTAVEPQNEIIGNGIDEDCDGSDLEACKLKVPSNQAYSERRFDLDFVCLDNHEKIEYSMNSGSFRTSCTNCNLVNDQVSFREGANNLRMKVTDGEVEDYYKTNLLIDTRDPRITKAEPRRGFSDGLFYVEFTEDNPTSLDLWYGNSHRAKSVNLNSCVENRGRKQCSVSVDLSDFDQKEISYWFNLTDVAGNSDVSRETFVAVDISPPDIEGISHSVNGRRTQITLTINETNFDKVEFFDTHDPRARWKTLCSRLTSGVCSGRVTFADGFHELILNVTDEANNHVSTEISFYTDSRAPRISKTEPRRGYANGVFYAEIDESNLVSSYLNYGNDIVGFRSAHIDPDTCSPIRRGVLCSSEVNLIDYDDGEISYWFNATDILGQTGTSRTTRLDVDATDPNLTVIDPLIEGRRVTFDITVSERVTLEYMDRLSSNPRFRTLCRNCDEYDRSKTFSSGQHDLLIRATDPAGNEDDTSVFFEVG